MEILQVTGSTVDETILQFTVEIGENQSTSGWLWLTAGFSFAQNGIWNRNTKILVALHKTKYKKSAHLPTTFFAYKLPFQP